MKKVAIIMGSDSDLLVVRKAAEVLREFGVPYEAHVWSAHRTPDEVRASARLARAGFGVIIAACGMAAHLAGAVAALTTIPVVGIPIKSELGGVDAPLSTFRCRREYPWRRFCGRRSQRRFRRLKYSLTDEGLAEKLAERRRAERERVLARNKAVEEELNK